MNSPHIIVRKDGAVLSRLVSLPNEPPQELFWMRGPVSSAVNHRYAVRYPSADAAERGAAMYDADAEQVPA